jgi:hypothetical protein
MWKQFARKPPCIGKAALLADDEASAVVPNKAQRRNNLERSSLNRFIAPNQSVSQHIPEGLCNALLGDLIKMSRPTPKRVFWWWWGFCVHIHDALNDA